MTSFRPSTADSTEIAGVMKESPRNIAAPIMPSTNTNVVRRPSARVASAVSDSVPPSPLLSARSRISTYLSVTTVISDHRIIDSTPSTISRVSGPLPCAAVDRFAKRVKRAGADIAIDDADAAERERDEVCGLIGRRPGDMGRRQRQGLPFRFAHGTGLQECRIAASAAYSTGATACNMPRPGRSTSRGRSSELVRASDRPESPALRASA